MYQSSNEGAPVPASVPSQDARDLLGLLLSRRSVAKLKGPVPSEAELDLIFDAAVRAPDHGQLQPWRFVIVRGAAQAALADMAVDAARARNPHEPEEKLARVRGKILRAPMMIVLGTHLTAGHKVPESEQIIAAAAAGMNLLNAVHALGYGGFWVSGGPTYDPQISAALGFAAPDRILGFIHVGTPAEAVVPATRKPGRAYASEWQAP
jgi:nitroreductase